MRKKKGTKIAAYTDFFEGSDYIEDYDMWCPVGGSVIYQPDPTDSGRVVYYFR